MKWNWFCPLPPAKTGIADYSAKILPALRAHAEITLWTDQAEWDHSLANYGPVRRYDPALVPWPEVNQGDLNIYHIGNHPVFHGAIWQVARSCPGLVVLHDPSLHHLFGAFYRDRWKARSSYLALMHRSYGEASMAAASAFYDERLSTEFMAEHFPLTWHALEQALGVVVHSYGAFEDLKTAARLPVAYIPLPYEPKNKFRQRDRDSDVFRLVLFGFLGRNRRLEPILRALAGLPRRKRIRLAICGEIHDAKETRALVDSLGLKEIVTLRGFLSDDELETVLAHAHLAINLRFPSMGEASLSQLRIWEHALPSMITPVGWYGTLPVDTVCAVRPENEIEDIQTHVNSLMDDPERFRQMGERGRLFLERNHSPANYAGKMTEFAASLRNSNSFAIQYLSDRAGEIAGDWLKEDVDPGVFARVSRQIMALTGNE